MTASDFLKILRTETTKIKLTPSDQPTQKKYSVETGEGKRYDVTMNWYTYTSDQEVGRAFGLAIHNEGRPEVLLSDDSRGKPEIIAIGVLLHQVNN